MITTSEPGDDRRAIDVMIREIDTIPTVIAEQVAALRPVLRELVAEMDGEASLVTSPPEIILSGCGDSHFAGVAARLAFERTAGVRCRAPEALEFTRYEVRYVPAKPSPPVLVAVSYSGEVGRTIEAVTTAARGGWRTVALTGRLHSRLAGAADHVVSMDVPSLGFSPGTSTYVAMLCSLYVLAPNSPAHEAGIRLPLRWIAHSRRHPTSRRRRSPRRVTRQGRLPSCWPMPRSPRSWEQDRRGQRRRSVPPNSSRDRSAMGWFRTWRSGLTRSTS